MISKDANYLNIILVRFILSKLFGDSSSKLNKSYWIMFLLDLNMYILQ